MMDLESVLNEIKAMSQKQFDAMMEEVRAMSEPPYDETERRKHNEKRSSPFGKPTCRLQV
uniref:Uncharacterized protein n=1 Tax=Siphoviridae sp. ctbgC51 TaxID=2827901 RepID=A0A8S5TFJ7_9CAUD|nr:MAG TPA: hypothetical protein [Siphoviridae sp. ctbgC51]